LGVRESLFGEVLPGRAYFALYLMYMLQWGPKATAPARVSLWAVRLISANAGMISFTLAVKLMSNLRVDRVRKGLICFFVE